MNCVCLTYGDYARTSRELVNVLIKRMVVVDEVDGLEEGGASFSKYIGSRQQCMYACVCFVITFFAVYDSILVCDINNFEWFHGVVMQGGCASVLEDDS